MNRSIAYDIRVFKMELWISFLLGTPLQTGHLQEAISDVMTGGMIVVATGMTVEHEAGEVGEEAEAEEEVTTMVDMTVKTTGIVTGVGDMKMTLGDAVGEGVEAVATEVGTGEIDMIVEEVAVDMGFRLALLLHPTWDMATAQATKSVGTCRHLLLLLQPLLLLWMNAWSRLGKSNSSLPPSNNLRLVQHLLRHLLQVPPLRSPVIPVYLRCRILQQTRTVFIHLLPRMYNDHLSLVRYPLHLPMLTFMGLCHLPQPPSQVKGSHLWGAYLRISSRYSSNLRPSRRVHLDCITTCLPNI